MPSLSIRVHNEGQFLLAAREVKGCLLRGAQSAAREAGQTNGADQRRANGRHAALVEALGWLAVHSRSSSNAHALYSAAQSALVVMEERCGHMSNEKEKPDLDAETLAGYGGLHSGYAEARDLLNELVQAGKQIGLEGG